MYGTTDRNRRRGRNQYDLGAAYKDSFLPIAGHSRFGRSAGYLGHKWRRSGNARERDRVRARRLQVPATPNGYYYKVTTAGTSDAAPPTFPVVVGGTVADGTAILTMMGRILLDDEDDYAIRSGGIYILPDAFVTDAEEFQVDSTTVTVDVVQALVNSGKEFEVIFTGVNEARSPGKGHTVRMHRVRIGAASNLGFIGDDYQQLEITGTLAARYRHSGDRLVAVFHGNNGAVKGQNIEGI